MWAHFDPATGEIVGWEHSDLPPRLVGTECLSVADDLVIDGKAQKVDLRRRKIVTKTKVEKAAAQAPSLFAVKQIIFSELQRSDVTQIADYPISAELRSQWVAYRQALRRLSDKRDHLAMITAWPKRPDGRDPIAHLRKRIAPI